jgi:hypothetical protein
VRLHAVGVRLHATRSTCRNEASTGGVWRKMLTSVVDWQGQVLKRCDHAVVSLETNECEDNNLWRDDQWALKLISNKLPILVAPYPINAV